jgi:ACT domain-containing protein
MYQVNPLLAKLLAKENLTVEHGNYSTAWFDVKNRVLGLPIWKDHGKEVYDLLVGHEVGHALYTPFEGIHSSNEEIKGCPRSYINVVEDARIERKIRETYPGLIRTFKNGYKKLFDSGLFGENHDFDTLKLIDKINLKSKLSDLIDVPFNEEETKLFHETMNTETFSDVCEVVKKILAYQEEEDQSQEEDNQSHFENTESNDDSSDDEMGHDDQPIDISDDLESDKEPNNKSESELDNDSPTQDEDGESADDIDEIIDEVVEEEIESKSKTSSPLPEHNNEPVSVTDETFRSNEEKLLDINENGTQTLLINDYNQEERDKLIVPYSKLAESRAEHVGKPYNEWKKIEERYNVRLHCNKYIKEVKKAVQPAVKEFEMKKAAYQWQRAATAKTGSINVDMLHSYKYNEDIFARVTNMADAKNHGMMLLIDYSGSMHNVLGNVIQQTMHLVSFCKAVNIPFSVYAFTTGPEKVVARTGAMDTDGMNMVELINSDLKKKDYDEAMYNLCLRVFSDGLIDHEYKHKRYQFNFRNYISKYEDFGSTPLNQALLLSTHLAKKFISKYAIQKFNFITITDGDANRVRTFRFQDGDYDLPVESTYRDDKIKVQVDGKTINTFAGKALTESLLDNIRKTYNANTMGFFISEKNSEFNYRAVGAHYHKAGNEFVDTIETKKQIGKEYKKNKCYEMNDVYGYNKYYFIKGGNKALDTSDDEFNPITTKSIGNDFKKYSKSKKTNKVLMQKIGAAVA